MPYCSGMYVWYEHILIAATGKIQNLRALNEIRIFPPSIVRLIIERVLCPQYFLTSSKTILY
jgi:hypothetical protein